MAARTYGQHATPTSFGATVAHWGAPLLELLGDLPIETVPHAAFKEQTAGARAVIRTGEFTPYANILLPAGVVF